MNAIKELLTAVTSLSVKVMQQSPEPEQNEAVNRGLQLVFGFIFHLGSMAVSLMIFGIHPAAATGFALLTALLLFTADRSLITGLREQRGSRALLDKGFDLGAIVGPIGRGLASLVIGALMGAALALALFDLDTRDYIADVQATRDAPLIARLEASYQQTLAQKETAVLASKANLEAAAAEVDTRRQLLDGGLAADKGQRDALVARRSELWASIGTTTSELSDWTDKAACESAGIADNPACEGTSGEPGPGDRWQFATDKAARLSESLATLNNELAAVEQQLATLPLPPADFVLVDAQRQQTLQGAYDAQAAEYRQMVAGRPQAIAAMLAASPDRDLIDPMSIYARIDALGHLMASSVSFFWTAMAAKAASVVLELLPLLSELGRRATVYDLHTAGAVHNALRAIRKRILEDEAEDLPLFAGIDRQRREIEREAFAASLVRRGRHKSNHDD